MIGSCGSGAELIRTCVPAVPRRQAGKGLGAAGHSMYGIAQDVVDTAGAIR
jgi:hypothetical protein